MNEQETAKVATFATIIEIGKQVLLKAGSSDFTPPDEVGRQGRQLGDYTSELLAAALQEALLEQATKRSAA